MRVHSQNDDIRGRTGIGVARSHTTPCHRGLAGWRLAGGGGSPAMQPPGGRAAQRASDPALGG
eukprot:scaffold17100_cov140-Isochrysis_galbana.AAC.2